LLHNIIIILLGITTSFLGVLIFYALRRINNYEKIILNINGKVELINNQLKVIDKNGHFEADDEVGFFFEEIKELNKELQQLFETEVDDASKEEEKKEK
jgi:hypothetical protein|tara:strand:+ start:75 stop:371 length:297 start_codon:yes stop_codon:yes gene_type:complete